MFYEEKELAAAPITSALDAKSLFMSLASILLRMLLAENFRKKILT